MLIKPCSIHFISSASSRPVLNSELANCYSMLIRWTKHLRSIRNIREDVYERPLSDALPKQKLLLKHDALELKSEICTIMHYINEPQQAEHWNYFTMATNCSLFFMVFTAVKCFCVCLVVILTVMLTPLVFVFLF